MDAEKRTPSGPSKPVMVRVPDEMWRQLEAMARREASSVATVLRRLARERLEQLGGCVDESLG